MKPKIVLLILFLLLPTSLVFSQKLKVDYIIKNDSLPKKERKDFIYIFKETDLTKARYIGRLRASGKAKELNFALIFLKDKAQKKGSNSFKFVKFKTENGISEIIVDTYVMDETSKMQNEKYFPKNKIYFFGKNNSEKETVEEYKLNNETKTLKSFYYSVVNFNEEIVIKKGSALGAVLKLKPTAKNSTNFINFSGFGATGITGAGGGIGINFSGGSITQMDPDAALLLTDIYSIE